MSAKKLGLNGARDFGANQRGQAEKAMPGVMKLNHLAKGGKPHKAKAPGIKPRAISPQLVQDALAEAGPAPAAQPPMLPPGMKKGGKAGCFKAGGTPRKHAHKYAVGGVAKARHGQASAAGTPEKPSMPKSPPAPKVKFRGKVGVKGC